MNAFPPKSTMTHYFNPPFASNQSHLRQKKKRKYAVADSDNAFSEPDDNEKAQGSSPRNHNAVPQTLREQHLNVINAIMHRSLLKSDFERAGRAWAMLLRAEVNGKPYDVRPESRWGIGAEILLRGHAKTQEYQVQEGKDRESVNLKGIAEAKAYYDRLILQYPTRKHDSKTVDSATFFPVMYGLWVYEVKLRSKQAIQSIVERSSPLNYESVNNDCTDDPKANIKHGERGLKKSWGSFLSVPYADVQGHVDAADTALNMKIEQITTIRTDELKGAKEIAEQIDETISSPPYDKNKDLLQLRDMIALWIGDLVDQLSKEADISDDAITDAATYADGLSEGEEEEEEEEEEVGRGRG